VYENNRRISAREQNLPQEEVSLLRSLVKKGERNQRAKELFSEGWTLQAIGNAFEPSVKRSTVKYWVDTASSQFSKSNSVPIPTTDDSVKGRYVRKTKPSPGISPEDINTLQNLAPLARLYRAGMPTLSAPAQANDDFNNLLHRLYSQQVTISELARASNVTNRAIARRLGK
jgi:hypothetical protein